MYIFYIISVFAITNAMAFNISADMGDGMFVASEGKVLRLESLDSIDKSDLSTLLSDPEMSIQETPVDKIPYSDFNCYRKDSMLSLNDLEGAVTYLRLMCSVGGYTIPAGSSIVARLGSASAYACSCRGENPCGVVGINDAMSHIDKECGIAHAGDAWMEDWAKIYGRGFGEDHFC